MIYLQWYRDKGRGQEAADATNANQLIDIWPVARLVVASNAEANQQWDTIYKRFGVNATTYHTEG